MGLSALALALALALTLPLAAALRGPSLAAPRQSLGRAPAIFATAVATADVGPVDWGQVDT